MMRGLAVGGQSDLRAAASRVRANGINQRPSILHTVNEGPLTSQPPPPASSGRIVLLAENDPQVADLEKMVLMQAGYSVTLAETGPEALRLVRMQLPVAVVLESDLPDVNGVEVCRQLKADPLTHHIPVLFCTADPSAHQLARDAGADDFLVKPGEVMQLGERVTRLLKN